MTSLPATVDTILPKFDWDDTNKRTYLSYRVCGFTRTDSCIKAGIKYDNVTRWCKKDEAFAEIEKKNMQELRQSYAKEFLKLEFTHNMRLALEKDRLLLERSVKSETDKRLKQLSKEEWQYLRTIRPLYTAKELNNLENIFSDFSTQDWDSLVARTVTTTIIGVRKSGEEIASSSNEVYVVEEKYPQSAIVADRSEGYASEEDIAKEDINGTE